MATVTRENIANLHDRITVNVTKEDFMPSFEKSLKHYAKTAAVPGFRKGMVPAGMVKKMYGQNVYNEEVIRTAGKQLENYLQSEKLAIFGKPMLAADTIPQVIDIDAPADVTFHFDIGIKPSFTVPAIDNKVALAKYKIEVSDKMLDDELNRIAHRYGKPEDKELVESKDDVVYVSYEMAEVANAEKLEDTALLERYPAQLQTLLTGKKAGDNFVIRPSEICTAEELPIFLKNTVKNELAADTQFKVSLTNVAKIIPANIDETLFAQVFPSAEVKDEATFRAMISVELEREYERIAVDRLNNEIYESLVHTTPIELPVPFLKRWLKDGQDKPFTAAEVEEGFSGYEHQLRWQLITEKLIVDNKITVSLEEVNENIKARVLAYFGMQAGEEAPWMDSYMQKIAKDEKTLNETYQTIMNDRLFRFLHSQLSISETSISEEEFAKLPNPHAVYHHAH
ncbi:MAG: trigger factor [Chitinophagaceae bacterium]|nr:trigger factor [Chitinophagaceae bacterium]